MNENSRRPRAKQGDTSPQQRQGLCLADARGLGEEPKPAPAQNATAPILVAGDSGRSSGHEASLWPGRTKEHSCGDSARGRSVCKAAQAQVDALVPLFVHRQLSKEAQGSTGATPGNLPRIAEEQAANRSAAGAVWGSWAALSRSPTYALWRSAGDACPPPIPLREAPDPSGLRRPPSTGAGVEVERVGPHAKQGRSTPARSLEGHAPKGGPPSSMHACLDGWMDGRTDGRMHAWRW
eukprot:scaffold382_cov380-Prasinococcus_capsulatus_cf.AAC.23